AADRGRPRKGLVPGRWHGHRRLVADAREPPSRRIRDHPFPRRPEKLARPRPAAPLRPLAPRDPERDPPRIHGAAAYCLDAMGARSSLTESCTSVLFAPARTAENRGNG